MSNLGTAISNLRPNAPFVLYGDDIDGIIWHIEGVEPLTTAEVDAEVARLEQAAVDAEAERAAAKASAVAKLAALGLNELEVAALLGGQA